MKNIDLIPGRKESIILALKSYRDLLSRAEEAIWEDDGAWLVEHLNLEDRVPFPQHRDLLDAIFDLGVATAGLVKVELETDEGADEDA